MTGAEFLAAEDRPLVVFPMDEELYGPGALVYLRPWSGDERYALEKKWAGKGQKNPGGFRWAVIQPTVCDESGLPLFREDQAEAVMSKYAGTLEAWFDEICLMHGLREKDVEDLEKNSASPPSTGCSGGTAYPAG